MDLAREVTTPESYEWSEGTWRGIKEESTSKIAVLDFGIKNNILRILVDGGYSLKVFPAKTTFKQTIQIIY